MLPQIGLLAIREVNGLAIDGHQVALAALLFLDAADAGEAVVADVVVVVKAAIQYIVPISLGEEVVLGVEPCILLPLRARQLLVKLVHCLGLFQDLFDVLFFLLKFFLTLLSELRICGFGDLILELPLMVSNIEAKNEHDGQKADDDTDDDNYGGRVDHFLANTLCKLLYTFGI